MQQDSLTGKACRKCGIYKPIESFRLHKGCSGGRHTWCIDCGKTAILEWQKRNPKAVLKNTNKWREKNRGKVNSRRREIYLLNVEENRKRALLNQKKNLNKFLARNADRRAAKLRAVPKWSNRFFVEEIYHLATLRSRYLWTPHNVDHIVPLKSKLVCGLHCEANLQVIPAILNFRKHNTLWPDMP